MNYFFSNDQNNMIGLEERYYRLKYFYLIDVDNLINRLENDRRLRDITKTTTETLFHTVFEYIFTASKPYNNFLCPDNSIYGNTFFGEKTLKPETDIAPTQRDNYTSAMRELIYISLRNHCIIHGIFSTIPNNNFIEITAKNDCYYNFDTVQKKVDNNVYQRYTNRYSRRDSTKYSDQILKHMHPQTSLYDQLVTSTQQPITGSTPYVVPEHIKSFAFFLFNVRNFTFFDTVLSIAKEMDNKTLCERFFNSYSKLSEIFIKCINQNESDTTIMIPKLETKLDKLSFSFPMEYFYGFSTFKYLSNVLTEIHNSNQKLKYLDNELLTDTTKQLSTLPNVYSRHFFLKYAIEALISTDNPRFFLDRNPHVVMEYGKKMNSIDFIRNEGFSRLHDFFKSLATINIPILEDLWIVVLDRLLRKKITARNTKQEHYTQYLKSLYTTYLNNNYELLTADFTRLRNKTICSLETNTGFNYNELKSLFEKPTDTPINFTPYSSSTLEALQQIMLHYFNINNLHPDLPPITINVIKNYPSISGDKIEDFISEHRKMIFYYFCQ